MYVLKVSVTLRCAFTTLFFRGRTWKFLNRLSDGRLSGAKSRRRTKSGAILESLSRNVHERRTSTGSGFVFLGSDLLTFSGNSSRVKTLNKTNVVASRHTKREEASLPVNLRHPKTSLLKLPIDHFEVVRGTGTVLCRSALWDCFRNAIVSYWLV